MNHRKADQIAITARQMKEPTARAEYIRQECGADDRLFQEVTAILFGEEPARRQHDPDSPTITDMGRSEATIEASGDQIGPYRLGKQIGRGGFGVVFVAEQLAPIRRQVALKMIKPGMDSKEVLARFDAERQALAMMDHPNIAHVFDAGLAPSGRPYFVMEWVQGEPITDYCDRHRLTLVERIRLVQDVCGAIQHAHQKGVIHRDIKPGNILVTTVGDRPLVKVIDFGIAKALHEPLGDRTVQTRGSQLIGTPLYMAPEQAHPITGTGTDTVDTRSDIYSLGVVLYVLLTGRTPFDRKKLSSADEQQVRRMLLEEDPPAPSTQVTQSGVHAEEAARRRATTLQEWRRALRGDLDRIVMKCLEKDPARRYPTATDLARDLQRYLHHEPVMAQAPTLRYRFSKFARRHRVGLAVTALFAAMLVSATAVSLSLAVRAWRAEREARDLSRRETELRRRAEAHAAAAKIEREAALKAAAEAEATLAFLQEQVLAAARPKHRPGGRGVDVSLHDVLDSARRRIDDYFAKKPALEMSVRKMLGTTYLQLGEYSVAVEELQRAWQLARRLHGDHAIDTIDIQILFATAMADADECERACELLESAREAIKRHVAQRPKDASDSQKLEERLRGLQITAVNNLAAVYQKQKRFEQARQAYQSLWEEAFESDLSDTQRSRIASNYAVVLQQMGRWEESKRLLEEALAKMRRHLRPHRPTVLVLLNNLGPVYHQLGDDRHAEQTLELVLEHRRRLLGNHHPDTIVTMMNLATVRSFLGKYGSAEELFREVWRERSERLGPDHPKTLAAAEGIAQTLYAQQKYSEAAEFYSRIYQARCRHQGPLPPSTVRAGITLIRTLEAAGQWQSMERTAAQLWERLTPEQSATIEAAAVAADRARAVLMRLEAADSTEGNDWKRRHEQAKKWLESAWRVLQSHPAPQPGGATYEVTRRRTARTWALWHRLAHHENEAEHWRQIAQSPSVAPK